MARGIYKRRNIYWIRYAGHDGRIKFESSHSTKNNDAIALLLQRRHEIKEGKQPEFKKLANHTFKELAENYISWMNGRQKSAKIKGYIIGQLISSFGALSLGRFNTAIVEQLQTDRMNRGLKNSSVNKTMNVLKHMFTKAVEWEMVNEDILKRIRKVKILKDNGRRLQFLTVDQCRELIASCESHLTPIVQFALNTGCRKGEILSLKWENVDFKHGFISLDMTKNGERREIPINNTLKEILHGMTRRLDVPYVFYDSASGKPFKDVKRSFKTACKRIGLHDFHFHDLRHTFASHLVMSGVDLTTVKELLGHKNLNMTLRYAHLADSHKTKAVDILDNTLNGTPTIQKVYDLGVNR